jgi:hypothetical protein
MVAANVCGWLLCRTCAISPGWLISGNGGSVWLPAQRGLQCVATVFRQQFGILYFAGSQSALFLGGRALR